MEGVGLSSRLTGHLEPGGGRYRGINSIGPDLLFLPAGRIIAAAGLDLVLSLLGFDFYFAETAVASGIRWGVADVVLAAEFGGNVVECFTQLVDLVADVDDAPARFLGKLLHLGIARVEQRSAVESAVGDEQHVANYVCLLGGFNRVFNLEAAPLVFTVGQKNHRFAADFMAQLVVRGEINRVIKRRAARSGGGTRNRALRADRASAATHAPGIDLGLVERVP